MAVCTSPLTGVDKTNNICEWNRRFHSLVGHQHLSAWTLMGVIQQDQAVTSTAILQTAGGQPLAKRPRCTHVQQHQRLCNTGCTDGRTPLLTRCEHSDIASGWSHLHVGHINAVNSHRKRRDFTVEVLGSGTVRLKTHLQIIITLWSRCSLHSS